MNKHNDIYLVLFGDQIHHPDLHFRACQYKFDYLKDARAFAKNYTNSYIFKAHFPADNNDAPLYFKNIL